MRTTIELDPDTAVAVERLQRKMGMGVSEAINELIRRGLRAGPQSPRFEPISRDLGIAVDVSNIAEALDLLEGIEPADAPLPRRVRVGRA